MSGVEVKDLVVTSGGWLIGWKRIPERYGGRGSVWLLFSILSLCELYQKVIGVKDFTFLQPLRFHLFPILHHGWEFVKCLNKVYGIMRKVITLRACSVFARFSIHESLKVKDDHRRKFSNLSSRKKEA